MHIRGTSCEEKGYAKGRETTRQLHTTIVHEIHTCYLTSKMDDMDSFFFFFPPAEPKTSQASKWPELDGSGRLLGGKSWAVYSAVSIALRGQSLLFRLRCLSFRDTKHATSSYTAACVDVATGESR